MGNTFTKSKSKYEEIHEDQLVSVHSFCNELLPCVHLVKVRNPQTGKTKEEWWDARQILKNIRDRKEFKDVVAHFELYGNLPDQLPPLHEGMELEAKIGNTSVYGQVFNN